MTAALAQTVPGQRRAERLAALSLSLVSLAVWAGLVQLSSASPSPSLRRRGQPPEQAGAALVNSQMEEQVNLCLRDETNLVCRAVTRQELAHCMGDAECRDEALMLLAVKGMGRCEGVSDRVQARLCRAVTDRDAAACAALAEPKRTQCLALVKGDLSVCRALPPGDAARCRYAWHLGRALQQDDPALCAPLPAGDPDDSSPFDMRRFCQAVVGMSPARCKMDTLGFCRRHVSLDHLSRQDCPLLINALLRQRCKERHGR